MLLLGLRENFGMLSKRSKEDDFNWYKAVCLTMVVMLIEVVCIGSVRKWKFAEETSNREFIMLGCRIFYGLPIWVEF